MSFTRDVSLVCKSKLDEVMLAGGSSRRLLTDSFFAGGVITSHCKGEKVKDYDLFFISEETLRSYLHSFLSFHGWWSAFKLEFKVDPKNPKLKRCAIVPKEANTNTTVESFIEEFNRVCKSKSQTAKHAAPSYLSHNALSLTNGVQLIFRFVGEPEEVFSTFDYEHCKTYWRPSALGISDGKVEFLGKSLESLAKNELVYTSNSRFVLSAISRLNKFIKRGWGVAPSSLLAIASSAAKVNWQNKEELREELLGIYGISPVVLSQILALTSKEEVVDLDKVIEMLGEV
jgi:hypothetical protein